MHNCTYVHTTMRKCVIVLNVTWMRIRERMHTSARAIMFIHTLFPELNALYWWWWRYIIEILSVYFLSFVSGIHQLLSVISGSLSQRARKADRCWWLISLMLNSISCWKRVDLSVIWDAWTFISSSVLFHWDRGSHIHVTVQIPKKQPWS